jgi:glycosyltransferase involved in cell wall biosynthesis
MATVTSLHGSVERRLRIALVAPPWLPVPPSGYGGTERVIALLADGLAAAGHDVTLFAAAGSLTAARLVAPLDEPPPVIGAAPDEEAFHTMAAYLVRDEFDLIHDHTSLGPAFAGLLGDGPPVVHTLHGPWTSGLRHKLGLVDDRVHLVAISHAQQRMNPNVRTAGVVHNGIDIATHPFREQKGGEHGEDFLCFLGRVNPDKAPEVAIEVAQKAGMPLMMIVKRSEPEEWEYWHDEVAPLIDDSITVVEQPPHAVKVDLLGRARALVCPINWPEPFGLVFVEALACGTPVITRPLGAAPEIVTPDVGFLCDSIGAMVDAVEAAPGISPHACRARAVEHFSGDAMMRGYMRVYQAAINAPRRSAAFATPWTRMLRPEAGKPKASPA